MEMVKNVILYNIICNIYKSYYSCTRVEINIIVFVLKLCAIPTYGPLLPASFVVSTCIYYTDAFQTRTENNDNNAFITI